MGQVRVEDERLRFHAGTPAIRPRDRAVPQADDLDPAAGLAEDRLAVGKARRAVRTEEQAKAVCGHVLASFCVFAAVCLVRSRARRLDSRATIRIEASAALLAPVACLAKCRWKRRRVLRQPQANHASFHSLSAITATGKAHISRKEHNPQEPKHEASNRAEEAKRCNSGSAPYGGLARACPLDSATLYSFLPFGPQWFGRCAGRLACLPPSFSRDHRSTVSVHCSPPSVYSTPRIATAISPPWTNGHK
jgi:hypothetical protein